MESLSKDRLIESYWIPGYKSIAGNEEADRLGNEDKMNKDHVDGTMSRSHACLWWEGLMNQSWQIIHNQP